MLKSLLASALFAGLIAGLFGAALQQMLVVPLILEAELYETGAITHFGGEAGHAGESAGDDHGDGAAAHDHAHAEGGVVRSLLTVLTMIMTFCGFALFLVAGFALAERAGLTRLELRRGVLWGVAGFAAVQLMPALGLPPELPGAEAAPLADRQVWWLATVALTIGGLALVAFGDLKLAALGVVLIALPHLIGAPMPDGHGGVVPPELAGLFAARALGVGALTWCVLGGLAGHFWARERPVT